MMNKTKRSSYTFEFKQEAVRLVHVGLQWTKSLTGLVSTMSVDTIRH